MINKIEKYLNKIRITKLYVYVMYISILKKLKNILRNTFYKNFAFKNREYNALSFKIKILKYFKQIKYLRNYLYTYLNRVLSKFII